MMPIALAIAADPAGFNQFTARQLNEKQRALHGKLQGGVASETLANYGNHQLLVIHRESTGQAEFHETQADVILVRDGEGTLIVGGKVINGKTTAKNEIRGEKIEGGQSHPMKAGDVIHIPPRTPHQVSLGSGQSIDYVAMKVDAQ